MSDSARKYIKQNNGIESDLEGGPLQRHTRANLFEMMAFELRMNEEGNHVIFWRNKVPGKGISKCKGPEVA